MVVFKALLSKEGDVKTLDVVSGDPVLAASAMEAVKQWKYKPYAINSYPVEVETQIKVNFQTSN
jgi:protein TonB